ncbi:MAG: hypothetical protein R3D00_15175 [Bacteroidia bacterium]
MKRFTYSILLAFFILGNLPCSPAQDRIYLREGSNLEAKVLEIGVEEIKYKKSDFPDGPIFVMQRDQISRIVFENGYEESFVPRSPDAITLRNGEEIRAEIVEVSENNVIFRQGMETDTLPKTEIAFITYINGTVEKLEGLNPVKKKKKNKR